jgi:hypothetical protein
LVEIVPGPFSLEARQVAVQKEVKENYESYFERATKTRMWWPGRLPQRSEMPKYGHLISDDTKEILLGFLGVESFVDDYVFAGINAAGNSLSTRALYIQWGWEEAKHGQTFRHCLIDSGLCTQEYVDKYLAEIAEGKGWTFNEQTGYEETPLLAAAYAIFQERQTRWNYTQIRGRIWEEYGRPTGASGNRIYPAAAGALRFPEIDEGAHEANFTNIVRIYMKYFPDMALEALMKVSTHYRMPVVELPNGDEFVKAVLAAGLGKPRDVINEIMNPSIQRMGLADRSALKKAVRNFRSLPEYSVVHLPGNDVEGFLCSEDTHIFTMFPSGEFVEDIAG